MKLKVGDTILVEQAWEDESGAYHDEEAIVRGIDKKGYMDLVFQNRSDEVNDWCKGFEYKAEDYEPS